MEKRNKVGADDLGWKFHLYHSIWTILIISLFFIFEWWMAILIFGIISVYFVWKM